MGSTVYAHMKTLPVLASLLLLSACSGSSVIVEPIRDAALRATPLHFGLRVTPKPEDNPIDPPERFTGYHVGQDFEVGKEELNVDVPIFALCYGKVLFSGFAEGYGGLVVQQCTLQGKAMTVMYGHLTLEGLPKVKTTLRPGDKISVLAPANSHDSDGNRKHLHLGISNGKAIDMRGYVQTEAEMAEFLDPAKVVPFSVSAAFNVPISPYWQK